MDKAKRIKKELERLSKIYKELPSNEYELVVPLLEQASFMRITLDDLAEKVNEEGVSETYKNGNNQSGRKATGEIQAYNQIIKNYTKVIEMLDKKLPKEIKKSKLEMFIDNE